MKIETKNRKKSMAGFRQITDKEQQRQTMHDILQSGSQALNEVRELEEIIIPERAAQ